VLREGYPVRDPLAHLECVGAADAEELPATPCPPNAAAARSFAIRQPRGRPKPRPGEAGF